MKYLILVGDGMGDRPLVQLGGRTVLEIAYTPHMDRLAQEGLLGLAQTVPADKDPGSDVANMSLMGFDPASFHTGRSPIEAAAMGVELAKGQIAFRCNLVTLEYGNGAMVMQNYAAGHITTPEAVQLIVALDETLGGAGLKFHQGLSYRHLLVWDEGPLTVASVPPHDRSGQAVDDVLAKHGELGRLTALTRASWPVLAQHPVNLARRAAGRPEANSIWLWGQGTRPAFSSLSERFGLHGVVISAVDLVKGLGKLSGLQVVEVPGATGFLDTNYAGKVAAALAGLQQGNLAYVHVEAPDEAGHGGVLSDKIKAVEDFDAQVVGPLLQGLADLGGHRVLLATDHYTPISVMTHTREPVPFVIWDSRRRLAGGKAYNEAAAAGRPVCPAHELIGVLVED
ncbi:putative 2,3-bisphosphoglycerate-independent phosphoglycerate mutase [Desulfarculales bacterium]